MFGHVKRPPPALQGRLRFADSGSDCGRYIRIWTPASSQACRCSQWMITVDAAGLADTPSRIVPVLGVIGILFTKRLERGFQGT